MENLAIEEAKQQFELAREAIEEKKDFKTALALLEKVLELHDNPDWYSYVGLCIAMERGDFLVGEILCIASIDHDEGNPVHHLNLGKVYIAAGKKNKAIETLREGLELGGNERCLALLLQLGTRNPPFLPFLKRSHPLNKYLGIILQRRALKNAAYRR